MEEVQLADRDLADPGLGLDDCGGLDHGLSGEDPVGVPLVEAEGAALGATCATMDLEGGFVVAEDRGGWVGVALQLELGEDLDPGGVEGPAFGERSLVKACLAAVGDALDLGEVFLRLRPEESWDELGEDQLAGAEDERLDAIREFQGFGVQNAEKAPADDKRKSGGKPLDEAVEAQDLVCGIHLRAPDDGELGALEGLVPIGEAFVAWAFVEGFLREGNLATMCKKGAQDGDEAVGEPLRIGPWRSPARLKQ